MTTKSATVKVRLVVEVDAPGTWGEDCTVAQIRSQGQQSAIGALTRVLSDDNERRGHPRFHIVAIDAVHMVVPLETK